MNKIHAYIQYAARITVYTLLMACMCMHGMDHNDTPQQDRQNSSRNSEDIPHFEFDLPTVFDAPTLSDESSFQPLFGFNPDRADDLENNSTGDFMGDENVGIPQEDGHGDSATETSNADFYGNNRDFGFDFVAPYPETRQEEGHGNNGITHDDVEKSQNASESVNDYYESPIWHINPLSPHSDSYMSPLSNPFDEEKSESPIDLLPRAVIDWESYETSNSNEQEATDLNQQQDVETKALETGEATLETNENHEDTPQSFTMNPGMSVSNLAKNTAASQSSSNAQFHMGSEQLTSLFRGMRGHDSHPFPVEQALKSDKGVLNEREEYVPYFDASRSPYCPICMISVTSWPGHINSASHISKEEHFKSDESSICAQHARCRGCNRDFYDVFYHQITMVCTPASFFNNESIRNRIDWAVKHGRGYIVVDKKGNRMYRPYFGKANPRTYCPACDADVKNWMQHLNKRVHKNNVTGKNITPCSKKALCIECSSLIQYTVNHHCKYSRVVNTQRSISNTTGDSSAHSRDKGKEHAAQYDNEDLIDAHSNFLHQHNNDQNRADQIIPAMTGLHSNIVPGPDRSQPSRKRRRNDDNQHNKEPRREGVDQTRENSAGVSDTVTSERPIEQALGKKNGTINEKKEYVPYFYGSQRPYCPICMMSVVEWPSHVNTASHASNEKRFKSDNSNLCAQYARCRRCNKDILRTHHHSPRCKPASHFDSQSIRDRIAWAVMHDRGYILEDRDVGPMYRPYLSKDMPRVYCPVCDIEVKNWIEHLSNNVHKNNIASKNVVPCNKNASCKECGNTVARHFKRHLVSCSYREGCHETSSHGVASQEPSVPASNTEYQSDAEQSSDSLDELLSEIAPYIDDTRDDELSDG